MSSPLVQDIISEVPTKRCQILIIITESVRLDGLRQRGSSTLLRFHENDTCRKEPELSKLELLIELST